MASRSYPALHIEWPAPPDSDRTEQLLAVLDDNGPTAVEESPSCVVIFFPSDERRDRAADIARAFAPEASIAVVSISDEAWAERSQASITPVRVDRVVVTPPWAAAPPGDDIVVTIVPSMGFGTAHHASTRLCLQLLQQLDVRGRSVLDVGTGSGVLAITAWRLGAERVVAIDVDADAVASARENVDLNGAAAAVELHVIDLAHAAHPSGARVDLVLANLTGAMLERFAVEFASLVAPGGSLIASGFQTDEETAVRNAFETSGFQATDEAEEDGWLGIRFIPAGA